jgi:hypothetical protein
MLLLTYDPNVKSTPSYVASIVSPYGSEARMKRNMEEMLYMAFFLIFSMLPKAEGDENDHRH